jgi:hypothetical protein
MNELFSKIPHTSANVKGYNSRPTYGLTSNGINLNGIQLWTINGNQLVPINNQNLVSCNNLQVGSSFSITSDRKLKENIDDIHIESIDNLVNLKGKQYTFINDPLKTIHYGYIAQDVEQVYPNLVMTNSAQIKSINYIELIPLLVEKINNLESEIIKLKNNI